MVQSYNAAGLTLEAGSRIVAAVNCTNVDAKSTVKSSPEVVVDWTPPDVTITMRGLKDSYVAPYTTQVQTVEGTATRLHGIRVLFTIAESSPDSTVLSAQWTVSTSPNALDESSFLYPWSDAGAGVPAAADDLVYAIQGLGAASTGAVVLPGWHNPRAFDVSTSTFGVQLSQGVQYYGLVKAVSSWGGTGYTAAAVPLVFDLTPPTLPPLPSSTVYPGLQAGDAGINWATVDNSELVVKWVSPSDAESGIKSVYAKISLSNGPV